MGLNHLKEKAVNFVFRKVQKYANKEIDIENLAEKHNATRERIGRIEVTDLGKRYHFRIKDGELQYLTNPSDVDGGMKVTSDTLIALARGERTIQDPATGEESTEDYTPMDALRLGDLHLWGDAVTNDALLFARALHDRVYPRVQQTLQSGVENLEEAA